MLSVAIDLSLQGALWVGPTVKASSATIAPFRIDAVRTLGPAIDPNRIDGVSTSRIDGVMADASSSLDVTTSSSTSSALPGEVLTFSQIDIGSFLASRPFEREPSAGDDDKAAADKETYQIPEKQADAAADLANIDWSGFELFQDVKFTFAGGAIRAGLPTADGLVSVNILVKDLPPGVLRPTAVRTGTGDFFARLESLRPWTPGQSPPPGQTPTGNGPLGLPDAPGAGPGEGSPATPPIAPVPGAGPSVPTAPSAPHGPGDGGASQGQSDAAPGGRLAAGSPQYTVLGGGSSASGRLGLAHNVRIIGVASTAAGTAAGGGSTAAARSTGTAVATQTALLPGGAPSDAANSASAGDIAQYLLVAAGTQLSALSAAAQRLLGGGAAASPQPEGATAPPEIDYDALRRAAPFVALGLSPWQSASSPADGVGAAWKVTAGISLIVAVGGYWYCQEYSARRRQEALAASQFTAARSRSTDGRQESERDDRSSQTGRLLIGRISRWWRDEVSY